MERIGLAPAKGQPAGPAAWASATAAAPLPHRPHRGRMITFRRSAVEHPVKGPELFAPLPGKNAYPPIRRRSRTSGPDRDRFGAFDRQGRDAGLRQQRRGRAGLRKRADVGRPPLHLIQAAMFAHPLAPFFLHRAAETEPAIRRCHSRRHARRQRQHGCRKPSLGCRSRQVCLVNWFSYGQKTQNALKAVTACPERPDPGDGGHRRRS